MVTMQDIAREAGVSRTTVSLVLGGRYGNARIGESSKAAVLEAAKRLGYRRNELARAMITGKNNTLAFVAKGIDQEYHAKVLDGVSQAANARGFHVKLHLLRHFQGRLEDFVAGVFGQRPAGVVMRSAPNELVDMVFAEPAARETPLAVVGSSFPLPWGVRVVSDDERGAREATELMLRQGRRRVAHLSMSRGAGYVEARRFGYEQALSRAGLRFDESLVVHRPTLDAAESAFGALLAMTPRPDAVCCASDALALLALRTARSLGLAVPRDLAVAGYGNLGFSALTDPPLTTVNERLEEAGLLAATELLDLIERGGDPTQIHCDTKLEAELVERGSTAPSTN